MLYMQGRNKMELKLKTAEYEYWEQVAFNPFCGEVNKENIVPDVRGMGAKDAIFLLKQAGLRPGISGYGRVISQSLPAGQKAAKGAYVSIVLKP